MHLFLSSGTSLRSSRPGSERRPARRGSSSPHSEFAGLERDHVCPPAPATELHSPPAADALWHGCLGPRLLPLRPKVLSPAPSFAPASRCCPCSLIRHRANLALRCDTLDK